tara:strand:+ start:203 stop:850 length:648 start_codon:yes stop_codon:yes gene_type:complete
MSCCKNNKSISVNNSSGLTMKKKACSKFNKISSTNNFSINGINNRNIYSYIGNPNSIISNDPFSIANNTELCKLPDENVKISVKNYSSYLKTRIVNNKLKCNPVISSQCSKQLYGDISLNKHFNNNNINKLQGAITFKLKNECFNLNKNCDITINKTCSKDNNKSGHTIKILNNNCNITKNNFCINGFTPGYSIYRNKKLGFCLYNPPDAKVIAC